MDGWKSGGFLTENHFFLPLIWVELRHPRFFEAFHHFLGGGFNLFFIFTSREMIQSDEHMFSNGLN